jgi:hypothetical protein
MVLPFWGKISSWLLACCQGEGKIKTVRYEVEGRRSVGILINAGIVYRVKELASRSAHPQHLAQSEPAASGASLSRSDGGCQARDTAPQHLLDLEATGIFEYHSQTESAYLDQLMESFLGTASDVGSGPMRGSHCSSNRVAAMRKRVHKGTDQQLLSEVQARPLRLRRLASGSKSAARQSLLCNEVDSEGNSGGSSRDKEGQDSDGRSKVSSS